MAYQAIDTRGDELLRRTRARMQPGCLDLPDARELQCVERPRAYYRGMAGAARVAITGIGVVSPYGVGRDRILDPRSPRLQRIL
jgi:hypothetical protein